MTALSIPQITVQTLIQGSGGGSAAVSSLAVQTLNQGTAYRTLISQLTAQTLNQGIAYRTLVSQMLAQILQHSSADPGNGGTHYNTSNSAQILYTVGVPETPRQRAWTFDFDGHTFYCLDLGDRGCMVYDLTTQAWSNWSTSGYEGHFNFKNGFHWRDGKSVIGGGLLQGLLVEMEETDQYLDEGFRPVAYELQGVVFSTTEAYLRQYNLRLVGSPGRTGLEDLEDPPRLGMQFSDDNGANWSTVKYTTLKQDVTTQRIEFRSLGAFRQPGRIFRLFDSGGIKFIAYVMADVEGEE